MLLLPLDKVTVPGDDKDIINRWDLGKCLEKSVKKCEELVCREPINEPLFTFSIYIYIYIYPSL